MSTGQRITKLEVSTTTSEEEQWRKLFYQKIEVDLNEGIKGSRPSVFLWYKRDPSVASITRIEFSFNDDMKPGLVDAEYTQINKDLNAGVSGDHIFLWYFCGSTPNDNPIVDLKVTKDAKEEPDLLLNGWERLGCDLNRNAGSANVIYLWVKREKLSYISEVTASVDFYADKHLFELGFTRVDENTNRGAQGSQVFIWYRHTTDKSKALTALDVSTSPREESSLQAKGFRKVNGDLNKGTTGNHIFLWYKGKCDEPIKTMVLLVNPQAWDEYAQAKIAIINKNLNSGNIGREMYLAYK